MSNEKILPKSEQLDTYFFEYDKAIKETIDGITQRQNGNIIDVDVEFDSPRASEYFGLGAECLKQLAFEDTTDELYQALYRAMLFAFQTAKIIHAKETSLNLSAYIEFLNERNNRGFSAAEIVTEDVGVYLSSNPAIDALIGYYVDDIDEGRQKQDKIELAAGMIFMLIERHRAAQFRESEPEDVGVSIFERNPQD